MLKQKYTGYIIILQDKNKIVSDYFKMVLLINYKECDRIEKMFHVKHFLYMDFECIILGFLKKQFCRNIPVIKVSYTR